LIDKLVLTAGDGPVIGGWRFKFHQVDFYISAPLLLSVLVWLNKKNFKKKYCFS
jgi:hypothetical protein